ncbi:hypothetical protein GCM10020221_32420 [Streptomyces thioluteus]|uniref:Regulatory protein RecX n=1 Tax=Streptomyces thioluteus TaxID=66431 RepID=A0ABN3X0W8_STRTU
MAEALAQRGIPDDAAGGGAVPLRGSGADRRRGLRGRLGGLPAPGGRGLARRALARELRTKGVESAVIEEAVGRLDAEQEECTARELVERKLRATRGMGAGEADAAARRDARA